MEMPNVYSIFSECHQDNDIFYPSAELTILPWREKNKTETIMCFANKY